MVAARLRASCFWRLTGRRISAISDSYSSDGCLEPQSNQPTGVFQMALIHDPEVWRERLAALPLATYGAGETVFAEGTKTGRLLI